MAEEVTSGEVRTRRFDIVRKGYDRSQVDEFLASVARRIDQLQETLDRQDRAAISVGLDDPEALAGELNAIGTEVGAILEAARSAAEGMRSRAAADAEELTASVEEATSTMLSEATDQAHSMRAAAWNESSSMLQSALAEAKALVDAAKEEALLIRAEAEHEAMRHVGDAKRDHDAAVADARLEAEQILNAARSESETMLDAAHQAAELAQERARALEERRSELLAELEAARSSIGHLETEIESKRQELEEPEVPEAPALAADDGRTHHASDGGSVRIVSADKVVPLNPVDPDSFVAEVEELRRRELEQPPVPPIVEPDAEVTVIAPPTAESREEREPVLRSVPEPEPADSRQPTADRQQEPGTADRRQPTADTQQEQESEPEPEPELEPEPETADSGEEAEPEPVDDLRSLFAQLRAGTDVPVEPEAGDEREVTTPPEVPEPPPPTADTGKQADEGHESADSRQPTAESGAQDESPSAPSLIPAQNAALRTIKRALVDLQNDTLEHLRSEPDWLPDEAFTDRFSEPFAELALAVGGADDGGAAAVFAMDLYDSVTTAIQRTRDAGSGDRAVAAAASKVFRTWRSDEAERRVVAVAVALAADSSPV
jgi:DivIVA domain-containing protein